MRARPYATPFCCCAACSAYPSALRSERELLVLDPDVVQQAYKEAQEISTVSSEQQQMREQGFTPRSFNVHLKRNARPAFQVGEHAVCPIWKP